MSLIFFSGICVAAPIGAKLEQKLYPSMPRLSNSTSFNMTSVLHVCTLEEQQGVVSFMWTSSSITKFLDPVSNIHGIS